jgi:type IV pilus assembly protein PilV
MTEPCSYRTHRNGFSLIEMLVALLIVAVGVLGVAGLQAYSLKNNTSAYFRSQANALIYDIFDAMRANRVVALDGASYDIEFDDASPSPSNRATRDLASWLNRIGATLPAGDGQIDCTGSAPDPVICTVTVRWDDTRGQKEPQQMTTSMVL